MTSRQAVVTADGFTHASSVMPPVRRNDGASLTVTRALVPLNTSALPNFPAVVQVAPVIVPVLLLPDESATVVPEPSLNEYAATRPDVWARAADTPKRIVRATIGKYDETLARRRTRAPRRTIMFPSGARQPRRARSVIAIKKIGQRAGRL